MSKQKSTRNNLTDIRNNTRVRTLKLVKDTLSGLRGSLESEIARLNSDGARPIHLANDIAESATGIGELYLQAPENVADDAKAYAIQLAKLIQDVKQVERRAMRLERMSKGQA